MPSLLVRFRRRAISLTSGESQLSTNATLDIPPLASPLPEAANTPTIPEQQTPPAVPVSRHIVPNINALMDTHTHSPASDQGSPGLRLPRTRKRSLLDSIATVVSSVHSASPEVRPEEDIGPHDTPPRTRKRSLLDSFATVVGSSRDAEPTPAEEAEVDDSLDDNIFSSTLGDPGASTSKLSKYGISRLSQLSGNGTWSTFGRPRKTAASRTARFTPTSSARHSRMGSVDSSAAPRPSSSANRFRQGSVTSDNRYYVSPSRMSSVGVPQSVHSTLSRTSSHKFSYDDQAPPSQSPPLTYSSRQNSMTQMSHSSPSQRSHPDSQSSNGHGVPKPGIDSPRTFGNVTPPPHRATRRSSSASPPPLPPLDHPAFVATFIAEPSVPTAVATIAQASSRTQRRSQSYTFPRRRQPSGATNASNDENVNPMDTLTVRRARGRSLRGSSSLPQVRDIFPLSSPRLEVQRAPSRSASRHTSSRRSSAEWSAHQATVGVTSENVHEYGWPAEVSREMLRLSLHEPAEESAEGRHRGRHVPAPHAFASSSSCFPSLSPLSPPPPPPLHSFTSSTSLEDPLLSRGDTHSPSLSPLPRDNDPPPSARPDLTRGVTDPPDSLPGPGLEPHLEEESRMPGQDGETRTRSKSNPSQRGSATLPRSSNSTRVPRRSILNQSTPISEAGPSTPQRKPSTSTSKNERHSALKPRRTSSEPGLLSVLETPTNNKGKRKAEEVDVTPPDQKAGQRATFVIPETGRRPHHESESSSHAPSSYQRKRVRLSATTPTPSPSRPGSSSQNPGNTGSWSRRTAPSPIPGHLHLNRSSSRATSSSNHQGPPTPTSSHHDGHGRRVAAERRSISEMSIPISALIAPHAPSVSRSSTYHMRDPRRPAAPRSTPWSLHFKSEDEDGSPLHAWLFFIGFIFFPLWWVASLWPIPQTRHVGGTDTEKAVTLDDPQVEYDACSWRFRCRIMAGVAFLTYIPFIVLVAIFAR